MALFKNVNGVNIEMTPQEEADFEASRTPTLPNAKATAAAAIRAEREGRERAGVANAGRTVTVSVETLTRLQALKDAAGPGDTVQIVLSDGTMGSMPAASLTGLIAAVKARMLALMNAEGAKAAEVAALPDVAAVRAYDVTAGWPA